jgi:pantoate--beta-alanine ligase
MKVISSIRTLKNILTPLRNKKKTERRLRIGLVPTMGAFHEGHLSLMQTAKQECDFVVVSLFVNPLQFGPGEDFNRYPRDLARDRAWAKSTGVDLLWTPDAHDIVPSDLATFVDVAKMTDRWEGAVRPGHFRGVATIVTKLFQIIKPDIAYFGQKDYQQTVVIRQLVRDLHFDLKMRVMPTVRETDGLAMSSRNQFLSPADRMAATVLYRALQHAKQLVKKGERHCHGLQKEVESLIKKEPRAEVSYIAFCHPETLEPVEQALGKTVLLLAVRVGQVRLIDNMMVGR